MAHEDVACLPEVRKQVQTPIMLDESLCGMVDAERAVAGRTCDFFNLRQRENSQAVRRALRHDAQLVGEAFDGIWMTSANLRTFGGSEKVRAGFG